MAGRMEAGKSPARSGRGREKTRVGEFRGLFLRGERILLSLSPFAIVVAGGGQSSSSSTWKVEVREMLMLMHVASECSGIKWRGGMARRARVLIVRLNIHSSGDLD